MEGDTSSPCDEDVADAKKGSNYGRVSEVKNVLTLGTTLDADDYNMSYKNRGCLYLFNHKHFDAKLRLNPRNGTDADRDNVSSLFKKLGFKVIKYDDLDYWDLKDVIEKAAKADYSEDDCLAFVMLTHGDEGFLYAQDAKYKTSELWTPFLGKVCPTLVGKPKLFFIQACQGAQVDEGVQVRVEADSMQVVKIPSHADFLIACSTVPGYYSWRNTYVGSWFMQAVCEILSKYHETMDLLSMLTLVNRAVAYKFQSNVPTDSAMHEMKQMPYICSMLTRKVYLRPK